VIAIQSSHAVYRREREIWSRRAVDVYRSAIPSCRPSVCKRCVTALIPIALTTDCDLVHYRAAPGFVLVNCTAADRQISLPPLPPIVIAWSPLYRSGWLQPLTARPVLSSCYGTSSFVDRWCSLMLCGLMESSHVCSEWFLSTSWWMTDAISSIATPLKLAYKSYMEEMDERDEKV